MTGKTKRILGVVVKWRHCANGLLCSNSSGRAWIRLWPAGLNWHFRLKQIFLIFSALFASCSNELRLNNCLVPRRLSLDENVRAKKGGKETPFPWSLAVCHQSLAFRARLYHSKTEAPEEKAGLTMYPWLGSQFNFTFLTKIKIKENFKKACFG